MKILYVIEGISAKGGLERILTDKMNVLSGDSDMDIALMTVWKDDKESAYPLSGRIRRFCLEVPRPKSVMGMACAMPRVLCRYNRAVRRATPDVVVYFRAIGATLAAFSTWRGRSVFEAHLARQHNNHTWLYPLMERRVDVVVCLTRQDAENYPHAARVEVIPNFTRQECDALPEEREEHRHCVFVGRLSPEKDPLHLLTLWQKIWQKNPGWTLDIYGEGELEDRVRESVARMGLDDSVVMHGVTDDVSRIYAGADILLLASRTEGLPMVIIEAMRCGLPVVSTDCPHGPADMITNGENGFLIPMDDDEAYVSAVSVLMNDAALRRRMGARAQESSRRYGMDAIVQRWKDLFGGLK